MTVPSSPSTAADWALLQSATQYIYREARLQDERAYAQWESLWDDDGVYWIPANGDDADPEHQMSIVYDNRSRIAIRVRQLLTGKRHSQIPASRTRRLVSNVEWLGREEDCLELAANALVFESASRGEQVWASRNTYRLRIVSGEFKLVFKKVVLVNNDKALFTLSFLI